MKGDGQAREFRNSYDRGRESSQYVMEKHDGSRAFAGPMDNDSRRSTADAELNVSVLGQCVKVIYR